MVAVHSRCLRIARSGKTSSVAVRLDQVLTFTDQLPASIGAPVTFQITRLDRKEFCQHLLDTHRKLADLGGPAADTFRSIVEQLAKEIKEL